MKIRERILVKEGQRVGSVRICAGEVEGRDAMKKESPERSHAVEVIRNYDTLVSLITESNPSRSMTLVLS